MRVLRVVASLATPMVFFHSTINMFDRPLSPCRADLTYIYLSFPFSLRPSACALLVTSHYYSLRLFFPQVFWATVYGSSVPG